MVMKMNHNRLLIIGIFLLMFFMYGCLDNPNSYTAKRLEVSSHMSSGDFNECMCVKCTMSTGSSLSDKFVVNSLGTGACWVDKGSACNRINLAKFIAEDDEFNFVRTLGYGIGYDMYSFEMADGEFGQKLDYVPRLVYSNYRFPYYDTEPFEGWDSVEGDAIDCLMDRGITPIYFMDFDVVHSIYHEVDSGHLSGDTRIAKENMLEIYSRVNSKYSDFVDALDLDKHPAAVIVPSVEFTLPEVELVSDAVDKVSSAASGGNVFSSDRPVNIGLMPCQTNPVISPDMYDTDPLFVILDQFKDNHPKQFKRVAYVFNEVFIDDAEYACDYDYALLSAVGRSKEILYRYGKPTFLVVGVSTDCIKDSQDAANFSMTLMRYSDFMRQYGVIGVILPYYKTSILSGKQSRMDSAFQPIPIPKAEYCLDPFKDLSGTSQVGQGFEYTYSGKSIDPGYMDDFYSVYREQIDSMSYDANLKSELRKTIAWYYDKGLNGLVFDMDGMNLSGACDYLGRPDSIVLGYDDVKNYPLRCVAPGDVCFSYTVDLGDSEGLLSQSLSTSWTGWVDIDYDDNYCAYVFESALPFSSVSGLDPRIVGSITSGFDPGLWYEVESDLVYNGWFTWGSFVNKDSTAIETALFMYVVRYTSPNVYDDLVKKRYEVYDSQSSTRVKISSVSRLYKLCNSVGASACRAVNNYRNYVKSCNLDSSFGEFHAFVNGIEDKLKNGNC